MTDPYYGTFNPAQHFPHLVNFLDRIRQVNPIYVHWDLAGYYSLWLADQFLSKMSDQRIAQYIDHEMDGPPPAGEQWQHIHHTLGRLSFTGDPSSVV